MRLVDLIQGLPLATGQLAKAAGSPVEVMGVTHDSRRVRPGDLFVALEGERHDGRSYAGEAAGKGAVAVLGRGEPPADLAVGWLSTEEDPRSLLGPLASRIYGAPDRELLTVGVTGTNGKSTTCHLLQAALDASGKPAGVLGNLGYRFRHLAFDGDRTTPEASDLFRILREMRKAGAEAVALEVSSHALALGRVGGASFDLAIFTNLTRDHFDFHGGFEAYYEVKRSLFDKLKAGGRAVVGLRDAYGQRMAQELRTKGLALTTFGPEGDVRIVEEALTAEGIQGTIVTPRGSYRFHSPLIGSFNVENLEAAAAGAAALGLSPVAVQKGFASVKPLPGRLEPVPVPQGCSVRAFIDFAHTDAALAAALRSVRALTSEPVLVVFGCGGEKDQGKRPIMGKVAGQLADFPFATSDNPRSEDPQAILDAVETGLRDSGNPNYRIIPDRRAAIQAAVAAAPEGSVLLIAGKGHETEQVIGDRALPFSDANEVTEALEARSCGTADG